MENQRLDDRLRIADLKRQLTDKDADTQAMLKQARMQAELEQERAVIAKEREMQEELRNADRETVRLQAELEQLRMKLAQENTQKPKKRFRGARYRQQSTRLFCRYRKGVMQHE